ncbi:hypothetical protein LI328DRAFT_164468, partial [Trichoderma asperelloides]
SFPPFHFLLLDHHQSTKPQQVSQQASKQTSPELTKTLHHHCCRWFTSSCTGSAYRLPLCIHHSPGRVTSPCKLRFKPPRRLLRRSRRHGHTNNQRLACFGSTFSASVLPSACPTQT